MKPSRVAVPSAVPVVTDEDIDAVVSVLRSGILANGPEAARLESEFAAYCGADHAIAVSNGTDALLLAGQALGLGRDDAVAVSGFTFAASANAFLSLGCRVVPVDVDSDTFNISSVALEALLSTRNDVRAVVIVDLFGSTRGTDAAFDVAAVHGVPVIEDAAQAHGAQVADGSRVGGRAALTTFSLYATKNMAAGEGGLVTTNEAEYDHRIRQLRNHGGIVAYDHQIVGLNRRLTEMAAALARGQLRHLDERNDLRRRAAAELAAWCEQSLGDLAFVPPEAARLAPTHVFHQFTLRCRDQGVRDALVEGLVARDVDARVFYPYAIADLPGVEPGATPAARSLVGRVCSLPVHPGLRSEQRLWLREALAEAGAQCGP